MTDQRKISILTHLVTFLIGAGAAMCLCLTCTPQASERHAQAQKDTVERRVYVTYSGLELRGNTKTLDLPKTGKFRTFLHLPSDSVRVEYRDTGKTEYIVLQRRAFHTRMSDLDIYHSGVDSSIDSVAFHYTQTTITDTYRRADWRHEFDIYGSAGYAGDLRVPVGLRYTYYPKRWAGVGGRLEHDIASQTTGIYAELHLRFGF